CVVRAARRAGSFQQRVLLVGESTATAHLAAELSRRPSEGYVVVGAVGDERAHRLRQVACPYLGPVEDMERVLRASGATGAIVATDGLGRKDATEVVRRLLEGGVTVQLAGTLGLHHRRLRATAIGQETAFYVERVALTGPQRTVKRAVDIVGAGLGLVLASPVLAAAAAAIRLHDRGPALFRQPRVGRHGDTFVMWKLRTMGTDAEGRKEALYHESWRKGPLFKHPNDPRITRPGRWLRASSIDELPQLWNVLRGQMSLVGPRPALPTEVALFGENLNRRHSVRPGITGLWQVEARDSERFEDLERHDLFYVENWSVLLDLGLLVRTVGGVVTRAWRIGRHHGDALL
ncbi:MAG: sugar transferase, partial [Acidimicrobiales bacterium]